MSFENYVSVAKNTRSALNRRQVRSVYLITYSRAVPEIIDSRSSFASIILDAFINADAKVSNKVLQWVCSEEMHKDGGTHYHMAIKLERNRQWLKVQDYVDKKHGVKINFSSNHANYYSAWKYPTKEDPEYMQSDGHPDLQERP
jgi:hypothetical protein